MRGGGGPGAACGRGAALSFPMLARDGLVSLAALACLWTLTTAGAAPPPAPTAAAASSGDPAGPATADDLRAYTDHLRRLADVETMAGRLPGTPGNEAAAAYLEGHFRSLGLLPLFTETTVAADGTEVLTPNAAWRQPFDMGQQTTLESAEAEVRLAEGEASLPLVIGEDFNPLGYGSGGDVDLPLVFAGYAVAAGPRGYLGFAPLEDFSGKAVMVLRFEPMDAEGRSRWTEEAGRWSVDASLDAKFAAVTRRGAAAVVLVSPPGADDARAGTLETLESTPAFGDPYEVPIIHLSAAKADEIIRRATASEVRPAQGEGEGGGAREDGAAASAPPARGPKAAPTIPPGPTDLATLIEAANLGRAVKELPGARLALKSGIVRRPVTAENVGAVLPGRGALADQHVIVGAHFDHVGPGRFGSTTPDRAGEVHPGADDNASGSAGLLLAASRLAERYVALPSDAPARTIVFLGFNAEESGLRGSRHYVESPALPLERATLMVNLDMIGSLRDTLEAEGVGTADGLQPLAERLFDEALLPASTSLRPGTPRSDQAPFAEKQVATLFFTTGLTETYHSPGDTFETINTDGATRVAVMAADLAFAVATDGAAFAYAPGDEPRRQAIGAAKRVQVRVGIAPGDYSSRGGGILVARVFDDTSASEAGLQQGDRIISWNGLETPTVESWMPLLVEHEPGDEVEVQILRGEEKLTKTLKLRAAERAR